MNALSKKTVTLLAIAALALTFLGCSSSDDSPDQPSSDKISCIHQNLAAGTNTLDDVGEACGASESEVLAQLQPEVGTCDKNDLDFGKPINEIMEECGASEIAIDIPSSSSGESNACTAAVNNETHYCSNGVLKEYGFMTDNDGQTYKTVVIGSQTWMAEDLEHKVYKLNNASPPTHFYFDWNKAMEACPSGWHLPSYDEWKELIDYVNSENKCTKCAYNHLRSDNWWDPYDFREYGIDTYGFSAMTGGSFCYSNSDVHNAGKCTIGGTWVGVNSDGLPIFLNISNGDCEFYRNLYDIGDLSTEYSQFKVRCVKD